MRLLLAFALLLAFTLPAQADPVTAAIGGIAAWYASIGVVGQALVQIGVGLALSAASYGLQYLLSGGGKRIGQAQDRPGVLIPERDGLLDVRRVYGTAVVAGGVFFQKTVQDTSSSQPDIYVFGVTISEGICEELVSVIINGVECRIDASGNPIDAPWNNGGNYYLKVSFRTGTASQAIDPIILARFPTEDAEFRQRGIATAVIEMNFGTSADHHTELWGAGGIPQLAFKVKGLTVYDPRDLAQDPDDNTTWTWSENATLIEADWLRADIGFGIASGEIDWDSVAESADTDDEFVPTLTGIERRGTINGAVSAGEANTDVLSSMVQQNRALVRKTLGTYTIKADVAADPVATIHQGLLVGQLSYQNEPGRRAALNRVVTQFYPESRFNQSAEIAFEDAALIAADGETLEQRVSLRFCDSPSTAQRLGFALIEENRVGRTLTAVLDIAVLVAAGKPAGQMLEAGDVGWCEFDAPYDTINGLYKINGLEIGGDFTVTVAMSGTTEDIILGWSTALEQAFEE